MVAFDLDMPATILEIAGYTRDQISNPGTGSPGLIKSDGCSLLGILEAEDDWGDCYSGAPEELLPRQQVLIQSFRDLAPNSTPSFAGFRLEADGQQPRRKHVITDTREEEYYDLTDDPEAYEEDKLVCVNPSEVDDHRSEIAAARGLVITLDDPSIVDWDLPIGIPGQAYSVTFKAEGGDPGQSDYSWCLWDFDEPQGCAACPTTPDPDYLACYFADVTPHDPEKGKNDPDCGCLGSIVPAARNCPCACGLPEGLTFDDHGATATISGTYPDAEEARSCYEFVLAVMDDSVSPYTGQHQKYLRRFRIRTGAELHPSDGDGYDTYVSEGDTTNHCTDDMLVVRKNDPGNNADGRVAFLRFDRAEAGIAGDYRATGGELILHATDDGDLTDATLYYVEEDGVGDCMKQYEAFPNCGDAVWSDWDAIEPDHIVPIARICSIQAGQHVRFDITPYLTKRYLDCANQIPYYQFVVTSNEASSGRGFHAGESSTGDAPRLAFAYADLDIYPDDDERGGGDCSKKKCCRDCIDNDCDGLIDCADTDDCSNCNNCEPPCDP